MRATDGLAFSLEREGVKRGGEKAVPPDQQLDVVLKPLSRPGLGEINIDDVVFAVGRDEQPFASYGSDILSMLSRRHARIFREGGGVYLADLQSRNGTKVNRVALEQAPCQLRNGDEICFGGVLSYRVRITPRAMKSRSETGLALTLTPESAGAGLDVIVVTRFPFLVSKTDAAFSRYKNKNQHGRERGYLSRRHAYIYQKGDQAYIEDLASGNGTFVDGVRLQEHAVPLHDGVLIAFGGDHFVYRVGITRESGVEPPPNVGRAPVTDVAPARQAPSAVSAPVAGVVAAKPSPGAVRVPVAGVAPAKPSPGAVRAPMAKGVPIKPAPGVANAPLADGAPAEPPPSDRTQFLAEATSFLEIFCVANEPQNGDAASGPSAPATVDKEMPAKRRPHGRARVLLSELASLLGGGEPDGTRRNWWKAAAAAAALGALAATAYFWGASGRQLKDAVARGDYPQAAALANRLLEEHPDNVDLKEQATEAALKANVPAWLAKLQAGDFDGAKGVLAGMSGFGTRNPDLRPLIDELQWLGNLERLVGDRGGPESPIRIYADEESIEALIGRWNDNTGEHQRALARIASLVPQFSDRYSEALTHLRKLQSDASVYLTVIQRLKATIATELGRDDPEALEPVLKESAEKYPRLGRLDLVRQDLARYIEIRREARTGKSGRLFALLRKARFATPPFQQSFKALAASGQIPGEDVLQQYDVATQAWKKGNASQALAALLKMTTGPWAAAATRELERRQGVVARFTALQQARPAGSNIDQLLAFRGSLDADEDDYYLGATAADMALEKDKVIARAQESMNRARALWQEYRHDGAIEASQRIETRISDQFRIRARLLADASRFAQQGMQIYSQVDAAGAGRWAAIRDEIQAEARRQRSALQDLGNVLEPELLRTKLALLGDAGE
jgi:pSer/pThr/pTyr-binding forkhead associated (FHA) protein